MAAHVPAKASLLGIPAGTFIIATMEPALLFLLFCRVLTSVIDGGLGGTEDGRNGCAHVQLCQFQLIHKIWELNEGNHMGMVTTAWHPLT